jgi:hypothetical protein
VCYINLLTSVYGTVFYDTLESFQAAVFVFFLRSCDSAS